ncbi:hypothetical protein RI129_009668 [Pyrocoelia pectoralis]|uniref:Uncharacterized protein n=1 Tax=Pyrocoelia pectoralis TaxID=417401 RepID=A0AAN7ZIE0_9COLE
MEEEGIPKIKIGRKKSNLEIDSLAFADDLAILAENIDDMPQNRSQQSMGELRELIQPNALDRGAILTRARKIELAFELTKNIYNKKSRSINAKLRHYNTVIKPEGLLRQELRIVAQFINRYCTSKLSYMDDWAWMSKNEKRDFRTEKITDTKTQITWIKEVRKGMAEMKIDGEEVERRKEFREKIRDFRGFHIQEEEKKTRTKWTQERRKQHNERMKEYWKRRMKGVKIIISYFTWSI